MSLEVHRQEKESSRKLIRRFSRIIRQTGILRRVKEIRFYQRPLSKTKKKKAALRREKMKKKYEELKRSGKSERWS